jgi:hypothetical protein
MTDICSKIVAGSWNEHRKATCRLRMSRASRTKRLGNPSLKVLQAPTPLLKVTKTADRRLANQNMLRSRYKTSNDIGHSINTSVLSHSSCELAQVLHLVLAHRQTPLTHHACEDVCTPPLNIPELDIVASVCYTLRQSFARWVVEQHAVLQLCKVSRVNIADCPEVQCHRLQRVHPLGCRVRCDVCSKACTRPSKCGDADHALTVCTPL